MKKHEIPIFWCPAGGCPRWGNNGLYKSDKLKDHLNKAPTVETVCVCMVYGCRFIADPKDALRTHLREHLVSGNEMGSDMKKHLEACC